MSGSSDKSEQNQQAQAQIGQNTGQAQASLAAYLKANPSVLGQAKPPMGPQQMGGVQGGGVANAPQMGMMPKPPMQGAPQPAPHPPGPVAGGPPTPSIPPGLLALLKPQ